MEAEKSKEKLNEEAIEKKLKSFNNSQDSVQAVSLWIMHHRAQHRKIVDVWMKVMRKSEPKHKLTLFYLCNDVVQHAKRKKALYYLSCYKDILREAVYIVSEHEAIKPTLLRILNIWEERKIYDKKFVQELKSILENESGASSDKNSSANATPSTPVSQKPVTKREKSEEKRVEASKVEASKIEASKVEVEEKKVEESKPMIKDTLKHLSEKEREELSSRIVAEFKPKKFIDSITMLRRLEGEIDLKRKQLTTLRIDATSLEAVKQLKDRSHGKEFCKQFEDSCIKIEDYVNTLEREIMQRKAVLTMCENSEVFYDEQFKEAKIVANAYKNFGARVNNMKKKVDDRKKAIPDTPSPVPSPSADAPSPGNTPPLQDMDDNEQIDMELDEEQDSSKHNANSATVPGRIAYTAMVKSIDQPISSVTNISMEQQGLQPKGQKAPASVPAPVPAPEPVPAPAPSVYNPQPLDKPKMEPFTAGGNVLESRIASMLPNLALGTSTLGSKFKPIPPVTSSGPQPDVSYSTPQTVVSYGTPLIAKADAEDNSDERAATPVMDEQEEIKSPTPPRIQSPEKPKPVVTTPSTTTLKTNPIDFLSQLLTKTTKSSSSSNFLHSLSLLTNTVKSQYQQQKQQSAANTASDQSERFLDTSVSKVAAPASENSSPVSAPQGTMDPPMSSSWSGWKINAAHPPLPPQPSPDQPPPPIPTIPITTPPPGPSPIRQQPPFPPSQPPQPPSPLPTPVGLRFPNAANQSYPNLTETSQPYQVPLVPGFQPPASEAFNPVSAQETSAASATQPYQVTISQPTTQGYIDPSLPPPPPTSQPFHQPQQRFPTSPETVSPRPSVQLIGPRPSFPPPGENKGFNPTPAFNQLLFSYGGLRNAVPEPPQESGPFPPGTGPEPSQEPRPFPAGPGPEPPQEPRPFPQVPTSWDQSVPNSTQHEQNQGFNQASRPWDQPPPGPPPDPNAIPQNQFPTGGPYPPWIQSETNEQPRTQPPKESAGGPQTQFPPWDQPQLQVKSGKYQDQWEQRDMELVESPPPEPKMVPASPTPPLAAPAKGILRKRNSSLKEVTLVDDANSGLDQSAGSVLPGERIPVGILKKFPFGPGVKKPPTDIINTDQPSDVQSEFIAKLKRKTGSSNLLVPPLTQDHSGHPRNNYFHGRKRSNLTTIEPTPAHLLPDQTVDNVSKDPNVHEMVLEEEIEDETTENVEQETAANNQQNRASEYEHNEPSSYERNDEPLRENQQENENSYQMYSEHVNRYEESSHKHDHHDGDGQHVTAYQEGEQFDNHKQVGEPISTVGFAGDRESRSSNDMDLDTEEENQVPANLVPVTQMSIEGHQVIPVNQMPIIEGHHVIPVNQMPIVEGHHMIPVNQVPIVEGHPVVPMNQMPVVVEGHPVVPVNQMVVIEGPQDFAVQGSEGRQEEHWERDERLKDNWHDRGDRHENRHPKFQEHVRFTYAPRPRFDHFRPREPYSPNHRPFRDRFRGPRPRPFNRGPRPPYYRY